MPKGKRGSFESLDLDKILDLLKKGNTIKEISEALGTYPARIYQSFYSKGFSIDEMENFRPGHRDNVTKHRPRGSPLIDQISKLLPDYRNIDIAKTLGCSREYVGQIRSKMGIQGPRYQEHSELIRKLRRLAEEGKTVPEISEKLNINEDAVRCLTGNCSYGKR